MTIGFGSDGTEPCGIDVQGTMQKQNKTLYIKQSVNIVSLYKRKILSSLSFIKLFSFSS